MRLLHEQLNENGIVCLKQNRIDQKVILNDILNSHII